MDDILQILEKDARVTPEEIAEMTGKDVKQVKKAIKKYEKDGVIVKYKAVINTQRLKEKPRTLRALIEVKVTPQKNVGFDAIAERIYKFPEVVSCYLLSGGYDLFVIVEGDDIHAVAGFVSEKLAPMQGVVGTMTHFLLKKYKEDGDILEQKEGNKRIAIVY